MTGPEATAAPGVAALPMYAVPGLRDWQRAWWRGLAGHLRAAGVAGVPETLTEPPAAASVLSDPRLLFAQTCGYPLTHGFAGRLRVIATPCYDAPGCDGAAYSSAVMLRQDNEAETLADLLDHTAAVNEVESFSGHHALHEAMTGVCHGRTPFRRVIRTGTHVESLKAVREGQADVCAVDAVTRGLLAAHAPSHLEGLRLLMFTRAAPGLPYVTRADVDDATLRALREGLFSALADPALADVRAALRLRGADLLDEAAYDVIPARIQAARAICPPFAFF
jgi:ABC-type phosphate/phosphonate transport system substrate-binding protein